MKFLYYGGWGFTRLVTRLIFRIKVRGQEHFPKTGGFILATNHISYYDPLTVGSWAPRQVYFFAKVELFKNRFFGSILRRVNALPVRRGAVDRQALDMSVDVIRQGHGLVVFPEGTRSRTDNFLPAKPGIGLLAVRAGCPIIPGYVHGTNNLKRCIRGRERMSMTFGEPISAEWVRSLPADKQSYLDVAIAIMERIGQLKNEVTENRPAGPSTGQKSA